jgi:hypothetical protein
VYDGAEIDLVFSRQPLRVWERLIDIGSPLIGWYILRRFDNITAPFRDAEENQRRLNERASDLKDAIVHK